MLPLILALVSASFTLSGESSTHLDTITMVMFLALKLWGESGTIFILKVTRRKEETQQFSTVFLLVLFCRCPTLGGEINLIER